MTEPNLKEIKLEVNSLRNKVSVLGVEVSNLNSQIDILKKETGYYQRTEKRGTCENCNNQVGTLYVIEDDCNKSMFLFCNNCARAYDLGKRNRLTNRIFRMWKR